MEYKDITSDSFTLSLLSIKIGNDTPFMVFEGVYPEGWPEGIVIPPGSLVNNDGKIREITFHGGTEGFVANLLVKGNLDDLFDQATRDFNRAGCEVTRNEYKLTADLACTALILSDNPASDYESIAVSFDYGGKGMGEWKCGQMMVKLKR